MAPEDIIIVIWSNDGTWGHSGIAVSNYKEDENGNMVEDGTYTYYDLWPIGEPKDPDKESPARYSNSNVTLDDLMNTDVTGRKLVYCQLKSDTIM